MRLTTSVARQGIDGPPTAFDERELQPAAMTRWLSMASACLAVALGATVLATAAPSLLESAGLPVSPAAAPVRPVARGPGESQPGRLSTDGDDRTGFVFDLSDRDLEHGDDDVPPHPRMPAWAREPSSAASPHRGPQDASSARASAGGKSRVGFTRRDLSALEAPREGAKEIGRIQSGAPVQVLADEGEYFLVVDGGLVMGWVPKSGVGSR